MNSNLFKALFLLIITCFSSSVLAKSKPPLMSWNGYGQARFGDDLETVERWMGEKATITNATEHCYYAEFSKHPEVYFMVERGIFSRVYRNSDDIKTFINISIGDSVAEIKRKFRGKTCYVGSVEYVNKFQNCPVVVYPSEDGHYYLFMNKLKTKGFILEEHDGKVVEISAGFTDSLKLKEGCY